MSVDHDHRSGRVRGVLCDPCNIGIGGLRDDPSLLAAAIVYLERPPREIPPLEKEIPHQLCAICGADAGQGPVRRQIDGQTRAVCEACANRFRADRA